MRDIADYEEKYKTEPCEIYQVKYRRKNVLSNIEKYKHTSILEIGCGFEPLFPFVNDWSSYIIVEPGETFINNAKKIAGANEKGVQFIQGFFEQSVQQLKAGGGGYFDFIILGSLLHEVEDPDIMLQALMDVCSDDTVIHINVPNAKSVHRLLAKEMGLIKNEHDLSELQIKMQRNRVYDLDSLCRSVEGKGFQVIEKGSYFLKFLSAFQMDQCLKDGIVTEDIFVGLDAMTKYFPDYGSEIYVNIKKA